MQQIEWEQTEEGLAHHAKFETWLDKTNRRNQLGGHRVGPDECDFFREESESGELVKLSQEGQARIHQLWDEYGQRAEMEFTKILVDQALG